MRRPLVFALLALAPVVLAQSARGPRAADLYHSAAQAYIAGETEQAIRDAERALALDPDDAKTQRLLDLLRQQQPPQDGEDGPQNDESDSEDPREEEQEESQSGQNESDQEEAERDQTRQDQERDGQQDDTDDGRQDPRQRQNQPSSSDAGQPRAARMSAAEAERLLDAVAADEELLVERMRRPTRMRRSDRDW